MVARLGHWCFRHRWTVLGIWLVAVVVGVLSVGQVFDRLVANNGPRSLESVQAYDVLSASSQQGGTVDVLIGGVDPRSARLRKALAATVSEVSRIPGVLKVTAPYALARDGRGMRVQVTLANLGRDRRNAAVDAVAARFHALGATLPDVGITGAQVLVGGNFVLNRQANQQVQRDL